VPPLTDRAAREALRSGSARETSTKYSSTPPSWAVTVTITGSQSMPLKATAAPLLSVRLPRPARGMRDLISPDSPRVASAAAANLLCGSARITNSLAV